MSFRAHADHIQMRENLYLHAQYMFVGDCAERVALGFALESY